MFPEQKCANNSQNCFNWFVERHISPSDGELASIRDMIEKMLRDYKLDRSRVFVTGLSAGGAMACALLASYPDLFAAGAIIAGLPFGTALGRFDAMMAMAFAPGRSSQEWRNLVRQASPGQIKWPKILIWHGSHDEVVAPANGSALVRQWINIHQVDEAGAAQDEAVKRACRGATARGLSSSSIMPSTEWLMVCQSTRSCVACPEPWPFCARRRNFFYLSHRQIMGALGQFVTPS